MHSERRAAPRGVEAWRDDGVGPWAHEGFGSEDSLERVGREDSLRSAGALRPAILEAVEDGLHAALADFDMAVSEAVHLDPTAISSDEEEGVGSALVGGTFSRRRGCHFTDTPSPSTLKRLLNGEGGAAE